VTMGMLTVNRRHERMDKEKEELHHMLAQVGLYLITYFDI